MRRTPAREIASLGRNDRGSTACREGRRGRWRRPANCIAVVRRGLHLRSRSASDVRGSCADQGALLPLGVSQALNERHAGPTVTGTSAYWGGQEAAKKNAQFARNSARRAAVSSCRGCGCASVGTSNEALWGPSLTESPRCFANSALWRVSTEEEKLNVKRIIRRTVVVALLSPCAGGRVRRSGPGRFAMVRHRCRCFWLLMV